MREREGVRERERESPAVFFRLKNCAVRSCVCECVHYMPCVCKRRERASPFYVEKIVLLA